MTDDKTKVLNVRVTEQLHNRLKEEADNSEISLAERVRQLLDDDTQTDDKTHDTRYYDELERQNERLHDDIQNERKEKAELLKLLDQQQQLTLTNNKRIELLETEKGERNLKEENKRFWRFWK